MIESVFTRGGWIPEVVRDDGQLRMRLAAGANSNHDPREFRFPIGEAHLAVIRADLGRHLLLWSALLPLCHAAGVRGPLDQEAAVALLDPVLLGRPADVDRVLHDVGVDEATLAMHGADVALLRQHRYFEAMHSATEAADARRGHEYVANRLRAMRGVRLSPVDEAVLKYVGHYLHGSTLPGRHPDDVDPALLPEVMDVIATAEKASAVPPPADWDAVEAAVLDAVRRAHPELAADAQSSVAWLMCSEVVGSIR